MVPFLHFKAAMAHPLNQWRTATKFLLLEERNLEALLGFGRISPYRVYWWSSHLVVAVTQQTEVALVQLAGFS
jgi:hypothetical protein